MSGGTEIRRLTPDRYDAIFAEPSCAVLVLGDSACRPVFNLAALSFYAAQRRVRLTLFCGVGAAMHADHFGEQFDRLEPKETLATRALSRFDDIDLQLAAEALFEVGRHVERSTIVALLDPESPPESAFARALEAESTRLDTGLS